MANKNDGFGQYRAGGGHANQPYRNRPDDSWDEDEDDVEPRDLTGQIPYGSHYLTAGSYMPPINQSPANWNAMTPLARSGPGAVMGGGANVLPASAGASGGNVVGSGSMLGSMPSYQKLPPATYSPRKNTPSPPGDYDDKLAHLHYAGALSRVGEIDFEDEFDANPLDALKKQFDQLNTANEAKLQEHNDFVRELVSKQKSQQSAVDMYKHKAELEAKVQELEDQVKSLSVEQQPNQGDVTAATAALTRQVELLTTRAETAEASLAAKPDFSRAKWEREILPAAIELGKSFKEAVWLLRQYKAEKQKIEEENAQLKARLEDPSS